MYGHATTHVFDSELVEGLSDLDLGLGIKMGRGKLLTLAQSGVDDAKVGQVDGGAHRGSSRAGASIGEIADAVGERVGIVVDSCSCVQIVDVRAR